MNSVFCKYLMAGALSLWLGCSSLPMIVAAQQNTDAVPVASAAAPIFTPIMAQVLQQLDLHQNMHQTITVEVKVDRRGKVTSAKALNGHPTFKKPSEDAALRWGFAIRQQGEEELICQLKFVYRLIDWDAGDAALTPVFTFPAEVEVKREVKAIILQNERSRQSGKVKRKRVPSAGGI